MEDKKLGDVGTHFLFENEHVKVWDLVLEPGQSSEWHHHTMHYMFIVTHEGTLKTDFSDGTSSVTPLRQGQVVMGIKDSVHRVTNVGDAIYSNAIVELKNLS